MITARLPDPYYGGGVGFSSASLRSAYKGTQQPLQGGGTIATIYPGSYWEIDISYPDTLQHELNSVLPFLVGLQGPHTVFQVLLPQYRFPKTGPWDLNSPTKRCEGAIQVVGENKIRVNNWSSRGGDLSIGDMLKFSSLSTVYAVVGREEQSNSVTITLHTNIKYPDKLLGSGLEPNEPLFQVCLKEGSNIQPRLQPSGIYSGFSISLREVVDGL